MWSEFMLEKSVVFWFQRRYCFFSTDLIVANSSHLFIHLCLDYHIHWIINELRQICCLNSVSSCTCEVCQTINTFYYCLSLSCFSNCSSSLLILFLQQKRIDLVSNLGGSCFNSYWCDYFSLGFAISHLVQTFIIIWSPFLWNFECSFFDKKMWAFLNTLYGR